MTTESIDVDVGASQLEALLGDDLETLEPNVPAVKVDPEAPVNADESDESDVQDNDEEEEEEGDQDAGDEDESEDEGDEEEAESEAISDETLVDIQIGDDTYEVNFAELRAGYLRNEEYVTKVQAAEAEYDSKLSDLESREAELAEELRLASVMVTGDLNKYDQINWAGLKEADPAKYQELRLEAMEARDRAQAVQARRANIQAMHQEAQRLRHVAYVKGQLELAEKLVPGFREPEFLKSLVAYGKDIGYSEDDIRGIADARHLLLLNNARLYAESVVRKKEAMDKKVKVDLPPVVKGGTKKDRSQTDRRVVKNAQAVFQRDKSVDSAAALLMTYDFD